MCGIALTLPGGTCVTTKIAAGTSAGKLAAMCLSPESAPAEPR